jgi:hypothetical protein
MNADELAALDPVADRGTTEGPPTDEERSGLFAIET